MDIWKTVREIGFFEMAINLAKVRDSLDVVQKVGALMPLPDEDIKERVRQAAKWLCGFKKNKYMFLTPEIALIEEMKKYSDGHLEIIIAVPCDMEPEAKERLKNNLPYKSDVTVLEEPYFVSDLFPKNGMLVACGYSGGDRAMILPDTYRMAEHYSIFRGQKVFVPYVELESSFRYGGWMEINQRRFCTKWRCR